MTGTDGKQKSHKEISMIRMTNVLRAQANYIMENDMLSPYDKAEELDVVLNLIRFLGNYDEHCEVLNMYLAEKKFENSFMSSFLKDYDENGNEVTEPNGDERE